MNKRQQSIKRNRIRNRDRKITNNLIKKEDGRAYKVVVFCIIITVLNWKFWKNQYIGLNLKYDIMFIVLPLILGVSIYFYTNKLFVKDIQDTKSSGVIDTVLSYGFMALISLFFGYFTMVTLADVSFKLCMDFSTQNEPIVTKVFTVESTYRNDKGKGIHTFSSIHYLDENNERQLFEVPLYDVVTSKEDRKIIFRCKEGFLDYYKIVGYRME